MNNKLYLYPMLICLAVIIVILLFAIYGRRILDKQDCLIEKINCQVELEQCEIELEAVDKYEDALIN